MMTIEAAICRGMITCQRLFDVIEANEKNWKCMDGKHRSEIGAWRCLMSAVGVDKDKLPETPYLDPEHKRAFEERQARRRAERSVV